MSSWRKASDQSVRDRVAQRKQSDKDYMDKCLNAKEGEVKEGDTVLLEKRKTTSCQQLTRRPIQCCLDRMTKLFFSNSSVSSKNEIYSMLSPSTFLTKENRQPGRTRGTGAYHQHTIAS